MSSNESAQNTSGTFLSNKAYDVLKFTALVFLPASGALYFGLSQIWGFPNGEEVVGTITLLDVFLGSILRLSTNKYDKSDAKYDGAMVVDESDPTKDVYSFEPFIDVNDLKEKDTLTFRVQRAE